MVKTPAHPSANPRLNQGESEGPGKARKIGPSTPYSTCREQLSPFGGLLGLVKFLDLVDFKEIFEGFYTPPAREPKLGHYAMVAGLLMLLFIGFNRIWHFVYLQLDAMLCALLRVTRLPDVTTFWRYMNSLGLNQATSLLRVMHALRERVWQLCELDYATIHIDIDTTVETVYGHQQGGRKGHNTQHRGKKGYRPVLCFIEETREYVVGKLRRGETMKGEEVAALIRTLPRYLPGCVQTVILRGDGEFISGASVQAALDAGYAFIFGNKVCHPPFEPTGWYTVPNREGMAYNECHYQPQGWAQACRFVVMRISKSADASPQLPLLEDVTYQYRIFVTNRLAHPHQVIAEYDKRADAENLIGEAKREGLAAIPSNKFAHNAAYFQLVMLAYNIWRSFKMLATHSLRQEGKPERASGPPAPAHTLMDHTIRIARLKLLFIAAKLTVHGKRDEVKYSSHDSRVGGLFRFLRYLDQCRQRVRPWLARPPWPCRHLAALGLSSEGG